jgi:hypothetical protein
MKLPCRPEEHIIETESWKILQNCLPSEWILRDITGRDYGIDCYIELVNNKNELTGDLVSIQLKGKKELKWQKASKSKNNVSFLSGIKTSTINYWMNLPVPTFLCVAELSSKKLYFSPIKFHVRRNYKKLLNQKTLSFKIDDRYEMTNEMGLQLFLAFYLLEKTHSVFTYKFTTLLINSRQFADFIAENYGRDSFLGVEPDVELRLLQMYLTCKFVADFLMIEWTVTPLSKAYEEDRKTWKDSFYHLHELTLSKLLFQLLQILPELIEKVRKIVLEKEKDYWIQKDTVLFYFCEQKEIDDIIKELKDAYKQLTRKIRTPQDLWG